MSANPPDTLVRLLLLLAVLVVPLGVVGQDYEHTEPEHEGDSLHPHCIKDYFVKGHFRGRVRNRFMATVNQGSLKDYWTNATGGSIHYESLEWQGFTVGMGGIFTFKTRSADLYEVDTVANGSARWEKELYDLSRPEAGKDLDRLEELYLQYRFRGVSIRAGKQHIKSGPMVKAYDGRMKPFVFRGIVASGNIWERHRFTAGWIDKVSPRGFTEWYKVEEAIGLTNNGTTTNGDTADYHHYQHTRGLGIVNYSTEQNHLAFNYWNYYLDRTLDMHFGEVLYDDSTWFAGVQYALEHAVDENHEIPSENRYIDSNGHAQVVCARIGRSVSRGLRASASYLHAASTGRFLWPRELGRDDFYVSQSRSRVDGLGGTDVVMLQLEYAPPKVDGFKSDLSVSRWETPGMNNFALNKYNLPSYYQLTLEAQYKFHKKLKGLQCGLLYVARYSEPDQLPNAAAAFNQTNFNHFSFTTNLLF